MESTKNSVFSDNFIKQDPEYLKYFKKLFNDNEDFKKFFDMMVITSQICDNVFRNPMKTNKKNFG